ncbi:hypothetical protein [Parabacteroides provencensis]|uniref:hypothetical protein n=1 Tax=Parabacteroides provencensis TaxID=1944636 RepID=UPI000C15A8AB|nr:hypothetical protein [Parabacteroides provencensis]
MELYCVLVRENVLQKVNEITGYTGKQIEGGFDKIASTEDESNIMNSLYNESILEILTSLSAYRPTIKDDVIVFDIPETFELKVKKTIEDYLNKYLINAICERWFKITKPDEVEYCQIQLIRILNGLKSLFNMRVKLVKRPVRSTGF